MAWASFETQDGLYSCAWSEMHENHVATASGDGTIKLWDITLNVRPVRDAPREEGLSVEQDYPIKSWAEHTREVYSIDWSNLRKDMFATASWDASIRLVCSALCRIILSDGQDRDSAWRPFS